MIIFMTGKHNEPILSYCLRAYSMCRSNICKETQYYCLIYFFICGSGGYEKKSHIHGRKDEYIDKGLSLFPHKKINHHLISKMKVKYSIICKGI